MNYEFLSVLIWSYVFNGITLRHFKELFQFDFFFRNSIRVFHSKQNSHKNIQQNVLNIKCISCAPVISTKIERGNATIYMILWIELFEFDTVKNWFKAYIEFFFKKRQTNNKCVVIENENGWDFIAYWIVWFFKAHSELFSAFIWLNSLRFRSIEIKQSVIVR